MSREREPTTCGTHTNTHTRTHARARTCIRTLARTRTNHALVLAHERIEKGMARLARGWLTCAGGGASGYQGNRVARGYRQGRRQCGGTDRGNHPTTEQGDERHRQMTEAARRRLAGRDCECTPTNYAQHRRCGCAYVSDGAGQRTPPHQHEPATSFNAFGRGLNELR
jgi:hypothetical protein